MSWWEGGGGEGRDQHENGMQARRAMGYIQGTERHSTAEDVDENRIPHESESHVPVLDWFLEASPFTDA